VYEGGGCIVHMHSQSINPSRMHHLTWWGGGFGGGGGGGGGFSESFL
jgi:hypothetical protein